MMLLFGPRTCHGSSPSAEPARRVARCNGSGGLRGDRAPAPPAAAWRDALTPRAARLRIARSARRQSVHLRGTAVRTAPAGSDRRAFETVHHGRPACDNS